MIDYVPEHQYRCTIIRGKSQNDMEDLLPLYANMVHKICPCKEDDFKESCRRTLSKALFQTGAYDSLSESNQKTVDNHLTEVAGTLLGLYYPKTDIDIKETIVYESETCEHLVNNNDYPSFFKNLCLNFQFPNGAKWLQFIQEDIRNKVHIKPFCYIVKLLYYAQSQPEKQLLTKQELGYYVLNNLDVLQGKIPCNVVYDRIMADRKNKVKREKLSGSHDWQHIKEQFNLLELSNIVETDATYIWLNPQEKNAIAIFIKEKDNFVFDAYKYNLNKSEFRSLYSEEWKECYGKFNPDLMNIKTSFGAEDMVIVDRDEQKAVSGATKSTVDLGDEGEAFVFHLEQERVRKYRERLVNKVLLLGKTKGLGYDISSIEADENPAKPEFARYIEVKATKRVTEPSFDSAWLDTLNLTSKEWVAAEQYGQYYNIYRIYFTKTKTIVIRICNPFQKAQEGRIEVYPTIYQMNFDASVIEKRYAQ